MNGRPFRIAAAGLCTALIASVVGGVSHFRTETWMLATTGKLPFLSAPSPTATPVLVAEATPGTIVRPPASASIGDTPASVAVPLPPDSTLVAQSPVAEPAPWPEPRANVPAPMSRPPRMESASNVRRKKEFFELPPPPEFLDETESTRLASKYPPAAEESGQDPHVASELSALRHDFERAIDQQRLDREIERRRLESELHTEQSIAELRATINELRSSRSEQRFAMQDPPVNPPSARGSGRPFPLQPAPAEPGASRPAPSTDEEPATGKAAPIAISDARVEGTFDFRFNSADLHSALSAIGERGEMNLVISPEVRGVLTATWRNMPAREAFEAVLLAHGLASEVKGSYILVSTTSESRTRAAMSKNTLVQMFRPLYISGRDLLPLIEPLLTPDIGRAAVTNGVRQEPDLRLSKSQVRDEKHSGGGDSLAQPDALVVVDYPEVIEVITRTIAEIDVPAPHVELEATILDVQLSGRVKDGVGALIAKGLFKKGPGIATLDDAPALPCDACCQTCDMSCSEVMGKLKLWTDVKLVSNARVLVLNKQPAELHVGSESITMLPTGPTMPLATIDNTTHLFVRPFVSADHMVRMEVSPEALTSRMMPMNIRRESVASVGTNVAVPNGGTLVIAGFNSDESVSRSALFKAFGRLKRLNRDEPNRTTRRELVVMITPRIVAECPPVQ